MRCLGVFAALGACGGTSSPSGGDVPVNIAIQHGALEPKGYTTVDLLLHGTLNGAPNDVRRSTAIDAGTGATASFDAIDLDPGSSVSVEATLRNDSGTALAYGRTELDASFIADSAITVKVRRPIAYIAGAVSRGGDGSPQSPSQHWSEVPATFSDLPVGAPLDGKAQVGSQAIMMIAAGASLYQVTQGIMDPLGGLIGPANVTQISTDDHQAMGALDGSMAGAVVDGAGADNGSTLAVA